MSDESSAVTLRRQGPCVHRRIPVWTAARPAASSLSRLAWPDPRRRSLLGGGPHPHGNFAEPGVSEADARREHRSRAPFTRRGAVLMPRTVLVPGSSEDPRVVEAVDAARRVAGLGTDVSATLAWCVEVGRRGPARRREAGPVSCGSCWPRQRRSTCQRRACSNRTSTRSSILHQAGTVDAQRPRGPRAGARRAAGSTWGVFAAEAAGRAPRGGRDGEGWRLRGTKPWCSLAAAPHACAGDGIRRRRAAAAVRGRSARAGRAPARRTVVRARTRERRERARRLRRRRRRCPSATPAGTSRAPVSRGAGCRSRRAGGERRVGIAERSLAAARSERADQLALVHLGRVDAALWAARAALAEAADLVDAARSAAVGDRLLAERVRGVVVATRRRSRSPRRMPRSGPAPLVMDEAHARRVADLHLYLRQHHGLRDSARIGRDAGRCGGRADGRLQPPRRRARPRRSGGPTAASEPLRDLDVDRRRAHRRRRAPRRRDARRRRVSSAASTQPAGRVTVVVATDGEASHPRFAVALPHRPRLASRRDEVLRAVARARARCARALPRAARRRAAREHRARWTTGWPQSSTRVSAPAGPRADRRAVVGRRASRSPGRPRKPSRASRRERGHPSPRLPDLAVALGAPGRRAVGRRRGARPHAGRALDQGARAAHPCVADRSRCRMRPATRRSCPRRCRRISTATPSCSSPKPRADGAESLTAAWFEDFYARHDDPWGFETRWYEERKRALLLASLPAAAGSATCWRSAARPG